MRSRVLRWTGAIVVTVGIVVAFIIINNIAGVTQPPDTENKKASDVRHPQPAADGDRTAKAASDSGSTTSDPHGSNSGSSDNNGGARTGNSQTGVAGGTIIGTPAFEDKRDTSAVGNKQSGEETRPQSVREWPPPPPDASKIEAASSIKEATLRGVKYKDVKLNLSKWGMKFTGLKAVQSEDKRGSLYVDSGKARDSSTAMTLGCNIIASPTLKVAAVKFKADKSDAGSLPSKQYYSAAGAFLENCATIPYDGAKPLKAAVWVKENIENVTPEKQVTTVIGSVEYQLSADKHALRLSIRPKK